MRVGYIHMIGGASGDMLLGALLDTGLTVEALQTELTKLPIPACTIIIKQDRRGGLQGLHVTLRTSTGEAESVRMGWDDFTSTISASSLSSKVAQRSLAVLHRLEEAERTIPVGPTQAKQSSDSKILVMFFAKEVVYPNFPQLDTPGKLEQIRPDQP